MVQNHDAAIVLYYHDSGMIPLLVNRYTDIKMI